MKKYSRLLAAFWLLVITYYTNIAIAADEFPFSDAFMARIDNAMTYTDYEERIARLLAALDLGTDEEVLYVSAIIIPRQVLSVAMEEGVCPDEIDGLTVELQKVVDDGVDDYLDENAETFRATLKDMVACIHTVYKDGVPVSP